MSEIRIKFLISYIVAVISAYLLKKVIYHKATKAIKEQKLSVGIFSLFPLEGEKAVKVAQGYIRGANIYFWFVLLIFPLIFILADGAI